MSFTRPIPCDVYRFALYLSGDPSLADDITSETFIRVWSSPEPVRLATVKAYLLTIARNLYLMERRRSLRTPESRRNGSRQWPKRFAPGGSQG